MEAEAGFYLKPADKAAFILCRYRYQRLFLQPAFVLDLLHSNVRTIIRRFFMKRLQRYVKCAVLTAVLCAVSLTAAFAAPSGVYTKVILKCHLQTWTIISTKQHPIPK